MFLWRPLIARGPLCMNGLIHMTTLLLPCAGQVSMDMRGDLVSFLLRRFDDEFPHAPFLDSLRRQFQAAKRH